MSSDETLNETILFDPERLKAFAEQLLELRKSNPSATVDTVLAALDSTTQSLYRDPLLRYMSSDDDAGNANLGATQMVDVMESPTGYRSSDTGQNSSPATPVRADATLDVTLPTTPPPANDLPPAARAARTEPDPKSLDPTNSVQRLPEKIGKFEIKGELGRGAFGVVYLGYDRDLQRNVAIKLSLVSDKKIQEKLRVEASKVAQVESDGIVPVYHIGNTELGATYIVQKYIQGPTLRDLVAQKGPLSPLGGIRLIRDIALGLEPAHLRDILHRDLKPDNILIDEQGKPWIADFGLAISEEEQQGRKGELAGTPAYMSPEQIKGRIDFLDPRSDIWSLGVMYYELLCGKLPFNGRDRRALAEQICELDPRPLHQRSPHLTEAVNSVFQRCCAKKPVDRFASARELAVALDQLIAGGLSDQSFLSSTAMNLYGDSTLMPVSTQSRTGTLAASTHQSNQQSSTQHISSRESISSVHTSQSTSDQTTPETSLQTSVYQPRQWWLRTLGQLLTFAMVVAASVGAAMYFVRPNPTGNGEVSIPTVAVTTPDSDTALATVPAVEPVAPSGGAVPNVGMSKQPESEKPKLDVDGSPDKPWIVDASGKGSHTTIQAAIDAGSKNPGPDGASIVVNPGAYVEQLQITQPVSIRGQKDLGDCELKNAEGPPIKILCQNGGKVLIRDLMIDAQGHSSSIQFNAIDVESGTLEIESCTVRTTSQNCIKAYENTSVSATKCRFTESREFAISTRNHKNLMVSECYFRLSGVQLIGGPGTITSSQFYGQEGVLSDRSLPGEVDVSDCVFNECIQYGTAATNNSAMNVTGCTYKDCKLGARAVFIDESDVGEKPTEAPGTMTIANSTFENCTTSVQTDNGTMSVRENSKIVGGIMAIGINGGQFQIENCSISEVASTGITVLQKGAVTVTNTDINGCGLNGVVINSGTLLMTGGSITDSIDVGAFLDRDCVAATFNGVAFKDNRSFTVTSQAENALLTFTRTRFSGSDYGIQVSAKETLTRVGIDGCVFSDFQKQAIYASGKVHVKYKNCDFGTLAEDKQVASRQSAIVEKL